MQECPHCYNKVMITSNGECPACRENIRDLSDIDKEKTAVNIPYGAKVPTCCFLCGENTDRGQKLNFEFEGDDTSVDDRMLWGAGAIIALLWPFYKKRLKKARGYSYSQYIGVCENCKEEAASVKPLNCLPNAECKLVVHKNFKKKFFEVNPGISSSQY